LAFRCAERVAHAERAFQKCAALTRGVPGPQFATVALMAGTSGYYAWSDAAARRLDKA